MIQHEYARVNGIRLHYVNAGVGPLLLFLHGFPDFWYLWNNQIAHFSQSYRVVAPDLRGYNLSDKPADIAEYRLPLIVEDIRALIDQLGQQPMILVGHDWGGAVAWEFAARYPDYLAKLIIFSAAPVASITTARRACWITSARLIGNPFSMHGHIQIGTLPANASLMACTQSMSLGRLCHRQLMRAMLMYPGRIY
jgi:pimeloyl-ACP methyl ester carboxylesterase